MSSPQERKSPLKQFQEMLATLLSVPKEELNEALEQEQAEKAALEAEECEPE